MAGRIPDSFIQDLIARTDIVQLVESRVELKRNGREFAACCPFHNEKTPSFTVSPQKQFYHCFGCGAHGTAIGFLMEYDQLEFVDAIEVLAEQAGMEVPREAGSRPRPATGLFDVLEQAQNFYRAQLRSNPAAERYLQERGLTDDIIERFGVGVAPDSWDALCQRVGASQLKLLEAAGLAGRRSTGSGFDKFRARITFPIRDLRGRPIAFGGRLYLPDAEGPKYLNSPETELFHKGRQLYGLYEARQAGDARDQLLVVEGYMDVIALAQQGIDKAVATLGTATSPEHVKLLFRNTREVVFCFDGDRAGRQAATRAMDSTLGELGDGRQARFLFLPDGEDPDSLVRAGGAAAMDELIARATPFSDYFFARYRAEVDMSSLDGRSRLVELCRPQLQRMAEGALRDMMFERLGELARTRVSIAPGSGHRPAHQRSRQPERISLVRAAIQALVREPRLAADYPLADGLERVSLRGIDLLQNLHAWCAEHPRASTAQVIVAFDDTPHGAHLARLASLGLLSDEADLESEFRDTLAGLEAAALRARLQLLTGGEKASGLDALREMTELRARLEALSRSKKGPA